MNKDDVPRPPMALSLSIVGGSMAISVAVYIVIARVLEGSGSWTQSSNPPRFLYDPGLIVIAVVALAGMLAFERFVIAKDRIEEAAAQGEMAVRGRFQTAFTIQTAVAEVPAILGLVYFLLGGTVSDLVKFCIVSWVLMGITLIKIPSYAASAQRALRSSSDGLSEDVKKIE